MTQPPTMGPADGDELIAQPKAIDGKAGTGIIESGLTLKEDLGKDSAWEALAIDGVSVGLDALAFIANPLGELVKAGVGWLMEHLDFIREPLEVLTGDPKQITAIAETWQNIGRQLTSAADLYQRAMAETDGWRGDSADKYRTLSLDYIAALQGIGKQAEDAASGVQVAGIVVATTRAIIFDIIATFISNVITRALLALASSWFTLGGSVAVFVASVVADAVQVVAKLQKRVGALLSAIQRFVSKYNALGAKSADAAKVLGRKSTELGREANKAIRQSAKTLDDLAPATGRAKQYADYIEGNGSSWIAQRLGSGTPVGDAVAHDGTRAVKEGLKAVKDTYFGDDEDKKGTGEG